MSVLVQGESGGRYYLVLEEMALAVVKTATQKGTIAHSSVDLEEATVLPYLTVGTEKLELAQSQSQDSKANATQSD